MADVGIRHVTRVTLFKNGDPNFNGKHIVVNPRYYRNFESFLDTATFSTQCTSAVTRICTPLGRHNIESVEQLSDGGNYVAVGREKFHRLKYGQPRPTKVPVRLPPVWRNNLPSSGRFRKVYEGERQALKRIYVFRNGDNITPARMILLKKRMLTDMELVLAALQESGLHFDFAISKLFALNGRQIYDCDEIVHDGKYVAIERGSRFKLMNYGGHGEVSPRNAVLHSTRLPPLIPQDNNTSVNRSPKKQIVKPPTINKPRPPPVKQDVLSSQTQPIKKQKENKRSGVPNQKSIVSLNRSGVPNQKSIVSISQDDNRESFSNVSLSATPPPLDESPDFTLSATNKAKVSGTKDEKLPEIGEIPQDIDELPKKEQETIGAHIYKASGMQQEWGDMINDSRNTPVKTLDNTPDEEVVEEIMEDIEDGAETSETHKESAGKDEKMEEESKKELKKVKEIAEDDKKKESNDETVKQERSDSEASNDDQSDEESEEEEEKDEDSVDEIASNDGDDTKADDDKVHDSDAVDNDDEKVVGADKNLPGSTAVGNNDEDSKDHSDTAAGPADDDNENDEEEDDDDKDESPVVSQNPSRRSSQEMNSEDEVKSEDEVDEDDKDDDDDEKDEDDEEDEKSEEEEESEDDKDEEDDDDDDKEDEDDDSSVVSEPEDDASNKDPESEKEDETTEENAAKENKTNQKVENQRVQPDVSKKRGKPDMTKGRSTKTRDVNKA